MIDQTEVMFISDQQREAEHMIIHRVQPVYQGLITKPIIIISVWISDELTSV